jgi:antitoxin MazE
MKAAIVPIGNSRGIRIPKAILEQCHIEREVILDVKDDNIIIKPVTKGERKNWAESFKKMSENKDDRLIINDEIDLDSGDWEW